MERPQVTTLAAVIGLDPDERLSLANGDFFDLGRILPAATAGIDRQDAAIDLVLSSLSLGWSGDMLIRHSELHILGTTLLDEQESRQKADG